MRETAQLLTVRARPEPLSLDLSKLKQIQWIALRKAWCMAAASFLSVIPKRHQKPIQRSEGYDRGSSTWVPALSRK